MNTNFLDNVIIIENEGEIEENDLSSDSDNVEINKDYLKIFKQMKNKDEMSFDDEKKVYFYEFSEIDNYLKTRFKGRLNYFENLKRKHNLIFNDEANEMFLKFLDFAYFEKINYYYILKKICDLYNIQNTLNPIYKRKDEKIWNDFSLKGETFQFNKLLCNKWR